MDAHAISKLVHDCLASHRHETPPPGSTFGVPWPPEKVNAEVERIGGCLVEPYLQRFEPGETPIQIAATEPSYADYWVVAVSSGTLLWFDPASGEFGLGEQVDRLPLPVSIGVRGDLVGVFCAI